MAAFVSSYAGAFADVVTAAALDTAAIDRQMSDFLATWTGSGELRESFQNPAVPAIQKIAVLDRMNEKLGLARELRNLFAVLIQNNRIGEVAAVCEAYRTELKARQGIRKVQIVTSRPLGDVEQKAMLAGVGKLAGAQVEATFSLDQSILGGAVVRIGSTVYDGSVRGRLERLKAVLVG